MFSHQTHFISSGEATDSAAVTVRQSQTPPLPSDCSFSPFTAKQPWWMKLWSSLDAEAKVGSLKGTWVTDAWNGRDWRKPRLKGTPHPCVVSAFPWKKFLSFPLDIIRDLVQSPASHSEENIPYSLKAVIPKLSSTCWLPCTRQAFALLNCMCLEVQESVWAEQATITPLEKCSSHWLSFSIQVTGKLNFIPSKLAFPPLNKAL